MIVDAFLIADEWDMLELRLRTLDGVVDRFLAVRCDHTHQGEPIVWDEPDPQRFSRWADRLRWYTVEASMQLQRRNGEIWTRPSGERGPAGNPYFQHIEKQQRNGVIAACDRVGVPADAIVMVSDVDEIPDPRTLDFMVKAGWPMFLDACPGSAVTLEQRFHSGALDLLHPMQPWFGTTICQRRDLDPQGQRDARTTAYDDAPQITVMHKAGYHLSWFGTDEERATKLRTFSHAELVGRFDPAEGRATLTHPNGEQLRRLSVDEQLAFDWPKPIVDGSFTVPAYWWSS